MPLLIKACTENHEKHSLDITCFAFHNNKLYSGADDGNIKLWDEDLKLLKAVQAHPSSIFSITVGNDLLYSCSNDGSVKSWSLDTLKEKRLILQEQNEMWKVSFDGGKLYVGDDAGIVKIFEHNTIVGLLEIHHPITDLLVLNNVVYTARDLYVIISEIFPDTKKMSTLQAIEGRAPVTVVGDKLCFCSRSGRDIYIHENNKKTNFKEFGKIKDAHELIINAICGLNNNNNENFLLTGGWDKTVKRWKISDNASAEMVDSCSVEVSVTCITTGSQGHIYVGVGDGRIFRLDVQ